MMFLQETPHIVSLTGLKDPFEISDNQAFANPGLHARGTIGFSALPETPQENFLRIIFTGALFKAITFHLVTYTPEPTQDGVSLRLPAPAATMAQYMEQLAFDLSQNPVLARFYNFYFDATKITIEAKEMVFNQYNFYFQAYDNPLLILTVSYTQMPEPVGQGYFTQMIITLQEKDFIQGLPPSELQYTTAITRFRPGALLQDHILKEKLLTFLHPPLPENFGRYQKVSALPAYTTKFNLFYNELLQETLTDNQTRFMIPGGLSTEQMATLKEEEISWLDLHQNNFISTAPRLRYIDPETPVPLFFIHTHQDQQLYNIQVKSFTQSQMKIWELPQDPLPPYKLIQLNAGPMELPAQALIDHCTHYQVLIADALQNIICQSMVFHILPLPNIKPLRFLFRNSLGTFDVISLKADYENYTVKDVTSTLLQDFSPIFALERHQQLDVKNAWYPYPRVFNRETMRWLKDFSLSREVYWLYNQEIIPVKIEEFEAKMERRNMLHANFIIKTVET